VLGVDRKLELVFVKLGDAKERKDSGHVEGSRDGRGKLESDRRTFHVLVQQPYMDY